MLGLALAITGLIRGQSLPEPGKALPLVIAAEDGAGPWGQADGTGCGNELVLAAYAAVNVPVKLEVMPYSRAKHGAIQGTYVACFGMAWTSDLHGKIVFAERPLYSVSAVVLQSVARPLHATDAKELKAGTKTGTVLDYEYPPAFYELTKKGLLVPMPGYGEITVLKNLDLKRLDAAIVVVDELKSVDYLLAKANVVGRVEPAFVLGEQGTYLGFSVAHPRAEYARNKFNEGFSLILKDGTYKRILDTWKIMPF
jgi:polar amino acid transport system substrate-binding protein